MYERILLAAEGNRVCQRCGVDIHVPDPPHLCKDVQARLDAYRRERRTYLLRLIRGKRCPKHGIVYQIVCGTKSCGQCWIEEPFRPAKRLMPMPERWAPKFAGYGRGRQQDLRSVPAPKELRGLTADSYRVEGETADQKGVR